jgi:GTP cyclohydrolase IB
MSSSIVDVQNRTDTRGLAIHKVGIKDLLYPVRVKQQDGSEQSVQGLFTMTVRLPHHVKGTHMSRFVEILQQQKEALDHESLIKMLYRMTDRLNVEAGEIAVKFNYFLDKVAPVSGQISAMDYQVQLAAEIRHGAAQLVTQVVVPVTSLCPCSKEISAYGAHNQRCHLTLTVVSDEPIAIEELITIAESEASCDIYGLVKRSDEKYITERAYENPKFVEDMVRDVALRLNQDARIVDYEIESENFESIHNHSAYALIRRLG